MASHQRETISSESQRKNSAFHHNGPSGAATLACPRSAAAASINGHNSTAARSLQRAMSKSREVLYERVAASNLRKSTSKSRERLCEMRLSISRSRDHLCDVLQPSAAQSRERLHSFRNLSKSHEVLSLLNSEQGSATSMTHPANSGGLFNSILPSTQSLECFTIPPEIEDVKRNLNSAPTTKRADDAIETNPIVAEFPELNKTLSESTETLCDETAVPDEITPSNSRPETPTEELNIRKAAVVDVEEDPPPPPVMKEEVLSSRADAVASSLKRLSSNGPPTPLKMPAPESLSPALGKSAWNWPTTGSILLDGSKSPVSPLAGFSARRHSAFPLSSPSPVKEKQQQIPTSPPADESKTTDPTPPLSPPAVVKPPTSAIDTTSLTESQRQLLTSCLNRRRASWACGTRQEDVPSSIMAGASVVSMMASKQNEASKLSVSELITSFNQCQVPGATATVTSASATTGLVRPSSVKKMTVGSIFHQQETVASPAASSISKIVSEKEKTVFKPVSTSIQVFQKNLPAGAPTSTSLVVAAAAGVQRSTAEASTRPRSHHWDVRALPRLPEDAVCSSREEEEDPPEEAKEKSSITASEVEEDFGLRSGSVSSDTGCSSSSDLSDRSSDEGLDATREPRGRRKGKNGSEPEADLIEGALTSPPASWTGRPRSFSVQSEISLLAQPWNRVCIGSVARAFEKFGTKVDGDAANPLGASSSQHRSRRQSTPGPFK